MAQLNLPDELAERVENRIVQTEFESVDDYVEFVVAEVITGIEREMGDSPDSTKPGQEVQNRLQSLGYLEE